MTDSGSSSLRCVVRPQRRYMPSSKEQDEVTSRLLHKIAASCRDALRRLAAAGARAPDAGACVVVGLLDPVSNVVVNAVAAAACGDDAGAAADEAKLAEQARRSLDGLVAFLVYFFPYLAGWEASRYLLLADADLLVAARLIVADRGLTGFSPTSAASAPALQAAIRLAAQVAGHPHPERLLHVWMSLSCRLRQVLPFLSSVAPEELRGLESLVLRLDGEQAPSPPPDLGEPWLLAASRDTIAGSPPYQHTRSLRMPLLDAIRGFYLRALARLPRGELWSRYHRSLATSGHGYGPLDPVSNIILNTVWYDAAFPAAKPPPAIAMVGPKSLTRVESRSFYGLVSFLQTRYHHLSEHDAVQCLVAADGRLSLLDPDLDAAGAGATAAGEKDRRPRLRPSRISTPGLHDAVTKLQQLTPCAGIQDAYAAAATAAWHPDPEAQAAFLASCTAALQGPALSLLQDGGRALSSEDVRYLAGVLSPGHPKPVTCTKSSHVAVIGRRRSEAQQRTISRKVKAALATYLLHDGEPMYELHVICGANEHVCGPEYCENADEDPLSFAPYKYRYSHVNFLATQLKCSPTGERNPVLFFAEFDNEEDEGKLVSCCRVDMPLPCTEHVRCLYCEAEGAKVVHPLATEEFHGGGSEIEAVICGRHGSLDNDRLICKSEYAVQRMCGVDDDFLYAEFTAAAYDAPLYQDDW